MIKRINIKSFGCFANFDWNSAVRKNGNIADFKRLNIIFGRNYSGKTTLSRIVRSLEVGKLPRNHGDADFTVCLEGKQVHSSSIDVHDLCVRVFNKDFVEENLAFLVNENESILPFGLARQ